MESQFGHYWYSNGSESFDLGVCETLESAELQAQACRDAGSGEEDWTGWHLDGPYSDED